MKTSLKTIITVLAISVAGISVAQAHNHHDRDYDRSERKQYNKHNFNNPARPHWKRGNRYVEKNVYNYNTYISPRRAGHGYFPPHRLHDSYIPSRRIIHDVYVPPRRVIHTNVIVSSPSPHNTVLPALAGGLIGSAIASDASHGDPGAILGGAVFGAILGSAIAEH